MRVVVAILLTIFFIGGAWAYTWFAESVKPKPIDIQAKLDDAEWRIVVTRTFDCIPDLDNDQPALAVRFKGEEVFRADERIEGKANIEITDLPKVEQGDNAVYFQAGLTTLDDFETDLSRSQAVRIQMFRGYELIKDQTIWSEPGATSIESSLLFAAPKELSGHEDHSSHDDQHN